MNSQPQEVSLDNNPYPVPTPGIWSYSGTTLTLFAQAGQFRSEWLVTP